MSSSAWQSDDEALVSELAEAIAADPLIDRVRQAGYAAFSVRDLDLELELLTLVHDSAVETAAGVRADAPQAPRMLVFESGELTLEVEIGSDTLMGRIVPAGLGRVVLESQEGTVHDTEPDDGGFFLLPRPARSPVRIRVVGDDTRFVTEWFPI